MAAALLRANPEVRTWGRTALPPDFRPFETGEKIGELCHCPEDGAAPELLVKHLFSAERLSIQVHPDNQKAIARGLDRGKDEAWFILGAEPGAMIGQGLKHRISTEALRDAALSGQIEVLVDWRPVARGDFIFAPAGTIHAIGGGISLIEIQQNCDVTYRLYDYGRPRELHLDDGLAVAHRGPRRKQRDPQTLAEGRALLLAGPTFVVERWAVEGLRQVGATAPMLVIPISGRGTIDGREVGPGQVWSVKKTAELRGEGLNLLVAYAGAEIMELAV